MRVCIAGKNRIAVQACQFIRTHYSSLDLCVITNQTDDGNDSWQPSLKRWATFNHIPLVTLEDLYHAADVVFVSLEFDRLISPSAFHTTYLFNLHFSLLPEYKGSFTSIWPILEGRDYSGVTLHVIDHGIDTGPIICQTRIPLTLCDTSRMLYEKYLTTGTEMFRQWFPKLLSGRFSVRPQSLVRSSFKSRRSINFSNLGIDLKRTAFEVHNQIRAFTFREYQLPRVYGHFIDGSTILDVRSTAKPGAVLDESATSLRIATIDYDLLLQKDVLHVAKSMSGGRD